MIKECSMTRAKIDRAHLFLCNLIEKEELDYADAEWEAIQEFNLSKSQVVELKEVYENEREVH